MPSRYQMERLSRAIAKILSEKNFATDEETNAFLQDFMANRSLDEILAEVEGDAVEIAQDLAYQALEADDPEEAFDLAQRALALDPECVDARMMCVLAQARTLEEVIDGAHDVVRQTEKNLGEEFFKDNRGYFWGLQQTRPYMRARAQLAMLLIQANRQKEALRECEGMLELNPDDNQGIRYTLLGLYLETGDLKGARALQEEYEEDSAVFAWGRVLERFLSGEQGEAARALRVAKKANPHVLQFLTGKKQFPKEPPPYYSPGDVNEAVDCIRQIGHAWIHNPDAVFWLLDTVR